MRTSVRQSGVFLFNIIPVYRPGMSRVFDYSRYKYGAASLPSSAQRILQNTLFRDLEDQCGDCLADLDLFYNFATDAGELFATLNWKNPAAFDTILANSPTFTENEGFQGDAVGAYLDTQWDPSNNGVNFTLDESSMFCFVNNEPAAGTKAAFGARTNSGDVVGQNVLQPKNGLNEHLMSLSCNGTPVGSSVLAEGFFHIRRVADNDLRLFKDGSQVGLTQTTASNALTNRDIYILAFDVAGTPAQFSDYQISCFGAGASLTGKESALYDAWNDYFTSL